LPRRPCFCYSSCGLSGPVFLRCCRRACFPLALFFFFEPKRLFSPSGQDGFLRALPARDPRGHSIFPKSPPLPTLLPHSRAGTRHTLRRACWTARATWPGCRRTKVFTQPQRPQHLLSPPSFNRPRCRRFRYRNRPRLSSLYGPPFEFPFRLRVVFSVLQLPEMGRKHRLRSTAKYELVVTGRSPWLQLRQRWPGWRTTVLSPCSLLLHRTPLFWTSTMPLGVAPLNRGPLDTNFFLYLMGLTVPISTRFPAERFLLLSKVPRGGRWYRRASVPPVPPCRSCAFPPSGDPSNCGTGVGATRDRAPKRPLPLRRKASRFAYPLSLISGFFSSSFSSLCKAGPLCWLRRCFRGAVFDALLAAGLVKTGSFGLFLLLPFV